MSLKFLDNHSLLTSLKIIDTVSVLLPMFIRASVSLLVSGLTPEPWAKGCPVGCTEVQPLRSLLVRPIKRYTLFRKQSNTSCRVKYADEVCLLRSVKHNMVMHNIILFLVEKVMSVRYNELQLFTVSKQAPRISAVRNWFG